MDLLGFGVDWFPQDSCKSVGGGADAHGFGI